MIFGILYVSLPPRKRLYAMVHYLITYYIGSRGKSNFIYKKIKKNDYIQ